MEALKSANDDLSLNLAVLASHPQVSHYENHLPFSLKNKIKYKVLDPVLSHIFFKQIANNHSLKTNKI